MQCEVALKVLLEFKIVIVVTRIIIDSIIYLRTPSLAKWILSIAVILFLQTFKFMGLGFFVFFFFRLGNGLFNSCEQAAHFPDEEI